MPVGLPKTAAVDPEDEDLKIRNPEDFRKIEDEAPARCRSASATRKGPAIAAAARAALLRPRPELGSPQEVGGHSVADLAHYPRDEQHIEL